MVASSLLPELQAALVEIACTRGGPVDPASETRLRRRVYAAVGGAGEAAGATRTLGAVRERGNFRDDEAILAGLCRQDQSASQTAVARHGGTLLAYATRKLVGVDAATVEAIVADAFVVLWTKAAQFEKSSNLKALLFKIVRDKIIEHYRRQARMLDLADAATAALEDDAADPLATLLVRERRDAVLAAIDEHCNPLEEDVLLLTANGLTDSEIADELGITAEAARTHRSRGRKKVRKALSHD